jgi:hypothetical protein
MKIKIITSFLLFNFLSIQLYGSAYSGDAILNHLMMARECEELCMRRSQERKQALVLITFSGAMAITNRLCCGDESDFLSYLSRLSFAVSAWVGLTSFDPNYGKIRQTLKSIKMGMMRNPAYRDQILLLHDSLKNNEPYNQTLVARAIVTTNAKINKQSELLSNQYPDLKFLRSPTSPKK